MNANLNIDPQKFTLVGKNLEAAQRINRPSMSYFQDAMRRLKKNKVAIASFWVLIFLIVMSLIGPVISYHVNGHTYRDQELVNKNQTPIMSNARSITMTANDVFEYAKYKPNFRKTSIKFTGVELVGTGEIAFKVGSESEEGWQGDKKEYIVSVTVEEGDSWDTIIQKLNARAEEILASDPDFRGVKFEKSGNTLKITSIGKTWFNTRYWFGTDELGRDMFTRLWEGGRISFLIAFVSVFVTVIFGVIYGGISGYIGGRLDDILMRIIEILMTVPDLIYTILLLQVMKPGIMPIIVVLIATGWMGMARLVRGEVMRLKNSEYVIASKALGADSKRLIFRHLIPNAMGPIIVNMTMMIPRMIFAEAFLSFIGLGVQPPYASWGVLANEGAKIFRQYPHELLFPAIAISLTMLAFNLLGDGLRDALDPRLRK